MLDCLMRMWTMWPRVLVSFAFEDRLQQFNKDGAVAIRNLVGI
jgi:hypothetical protein